MLAAPLAPGNENPGKYVPIAALVVAPPSTKASGSKTPAPEDGTFTKPKSKVLAAPAFVQVTCTLDIKAFFGIKTSVKLVEDFVALLTPAV